MKSFEVGNKRQSTVSRYSSIRWQHETFFIVICACKIIIE